ncbi:MAG TPA: type I DNA topoisomerase [bacterium]|nr:type I DNA topoisomerase [bacterium]
MVKSLVIVESPAKAKTIEKYLGKNYKVKASVGHVKDLPKSKLGVDVKKGFEPTYEVIAAKKKVIEELRKAASAADQVYLALDPDREGEAIAWHVAEEIYKGEKEKAGEKGKTKAVKKPLHRVLFNEITKKAVLEAIANPIDLNKNLYEAQQARRILDRLVGYQVSPLLWDKVRRGLSAGRVQTVALRLICERERAIKAFNPEEYWTIEAVLEGSLPPSFTAKLVSFEGKKFRIANGTESSRVLAEIKSAPHVLRSIVRKERKRNPYPPFITSRLQQDASQKLGFSAARTMMLAQQLYEGVDVGEGDPVGLITYMRTDSTRVSDEALTEVRQFIEEKVGKDYLPEKPLVYKNKKSAQDAHEAIRPTSVMRTPESVRSHLEEDLFKLYELIWKRFVACQMTPAVFDQTTFDISAGPYGYRANGAQMKFAGFLSLYEAAFVAEKKEKEEEEADEAEKASKLLPLLKEGETLKVLETRPEQHFTEPPPKFNDASLIRELEELGIGRPSTYATILSTLVDKEYVKKEQRVYSPTDLGFIVNDVLIESFPDIFNVEFTAKMETELDEVEEGKQTCTEAVKDFYKPFQAALEKAKTHMRDIKRQEIATDLSCERCNSPMVIKWGRRGEFLACTNYPECKYTREFERQEDGKLKLMKLEVTGELCSTCGSQMVIKSGRFGKFLACSKYPECKTTRAISTGITCPSCGGALAERRTKKGRTFYGCSQYPKCTFATWDKPLKEACPQCGSPTLVAKSTKAATTVKCPRENCDYTRTQN